MWARMFPLTPADVEGSEGTDSVVGGGRLEDPFKEYTTRAEHVHCLGYILRLPLCGGHWVALLPGALMGSGSSFGILCDSMYVAPFFVSKAQVGDLLLACAMNAAASRDGFHSSWRCFLIGATQ